MIRSRRQRPRFQPGIDRTADNPKWTQLDLDLGIDRIQPKPAKPGGPDPYSVKRLHMRARPDAWPADWAWPPAPPRSRSDKA